MPYPDSPTSQSRPDQVTADSVRAWVMETMRALDLDATNLSKRAQVSQSSLSRFMNGVTETLQPRTLAALTRVSPVMPTAEMRKALDRIDSAALEQAVNVYQPERPTIPLWGVHPVERDGVFRLNPIPLQTFPRPASMSASQRAAAWYAHDDTMAPRWRMGDLVVVDLARPAVEGGFALVRLTAEDTPNMEEVFVLRQYVGRSAGKIHLRAMMNGGVDESFPLDRVLQLQHILDWRELIG